MVTIEDLYLEYLKQKGIAANRPYRLPKEPALAIEKMRQNNQRNYDALVTVMGWFNTKWQNIDYGKYIACGFKLFPNFSYINLLNEKILKQYIVLDKIGKYHDEINRKTLLKSFIFIKGVMKESNMKSLRDYCTMLDGASLVCINDFVMGKVDSFTFTYLLLKKYVNYSDDDKDRIIETINRISDYKRFVLNEWNLFMKMEKSLEDNNENSGSL